MTNNIQDLVRTLRERANEPRFRGLLDGRLDNAVADALEEQAKAIEQLSYENIARKHALEDDFDALTKAVLDEREACAKVAESKQDDKFTTSWNHAALDIAAAIRARGDTEEA